MKNSYRLLLLMFIALLGITPALAQVAQKDQKPAAAKEPTVKQADLLKEAKISKEEATKTALAKVPNGTIKEGGLEKEKGKLIWSFDIASPGTKDITEVQVDAKTGEVVSVTKESAAAEATEKKAESKKAPKKK